jgi:hypothetical protein
VTGLPTSDDELLARLAHVVEEADPVPDAVTEAALSALVTRSLDAELAELVTDSDVDSSAAVRDAVTAVRLLSFESAEVTVEVQLTAAAGSRALRGLAAGAVGDVTAETLGAMGSRRSAPMDADGWFTLEGLGPGPLRLHLQTAEGESVVTRWVSI